jgi:hypothetical protein
MSIAQLIPFCALLVTCGVLQRCAAASDEQPKDEQKRGLKLLRVDFPDGTRWTLGEGGLGRPFMVRLVLTNDGPEPVRIWDPHNSEGASCPRVALTDPQKRETILLPPGIARAAGIPTTVTLKPQEVFVIELDLLRLIDERGLAPGKYQLQGRYENDLKEAGFGIKDVWTGKLSSELQAMEIVRPVAKSS